MKLYGISLTRNGQIETGLFPSSSFNWGYYKDNGSGSLIACPENDPEVLIKAFVGYPVQIPSGTGSWFENITTPQVDAAGINVYQWGKSSYVDYAGLGVDEYFGPLIPDYKYGFDPLWNVVDPNSYNFPVKGGGTITFSANSTYKGTPKPLKVDDVNIFKLATTLTKRILFIYNDSDTPLTNVKIKISDQTFKGAVCEIYEFHNALDFQYYGFTDIGPYHPSNYDFMDTDGPNYGPDYVKFLCGGFKDTLDSQTGQDVYYLHNEINIPSLGAAGTKNAWAVAVITQYATRENGNYAGTDDDYMVLSTESAAT